MNYMNKKMLLVCRLINKIYVFLKFMFVDLLIFFKFKVNILIEKISLECYKYVGN